MFRSQQIITATDLIKNFKLLSKALAEEPQALLVTQKSKEPLVLVNASIYEGLIEESAYNVMRRGENPYYLD